MKSPDFRGLFAPLVADTEIVIETMNRHEPKLARLRHPPPSTELLQVSTRLTIEDSRTLQPSSIWAGVVPDFAAARSVRSPHFELSERLENCMPFLRSTMQRNPASLSLPRLSFLHRTAELV